MTAIYVAADACPVRDEIYRTASRLDVMGQCNVIVGRASASWNERHARLMGSVTPLSFRSGRSSTKSVFLELPATGAECNGLRGLWLGSSDRAAGPDGTKVSSIPVPGLQQAVQRAQ